MSSITGQCNCKAIRVTVQNPPESTVICHCLGCRNHGGVTGSVLITVPDEQVTVDGTTKIFQDKGDSGKAVYRHFCGVCGTPIMSRVEVRPGTTYVTANVFPQIARPQVEIYARNKQDWQPNVANAMIFPDSPPS